MMLFDPRAALKKIEKEGLTPASSASFASLEPISPQNEANAAKAPCEFPRFRRGEEKPGPEDCKHGFSIGGSPKTWTGKIVPLDEWRTLTAWEKHGPDGRHWNGTSKKWESPK